MTIETTSAASTCQSGLWNALVVAYERFRSTERGYLWLDKLLPAYVFGIVAVLKALAFSTSVSRLTSAEHDLQLGMLAGYQAITAIFFGLIAAFYLIRRRPIRRVETPLQALVALAGTYIMVPVALGGTTNQSPMVLFLATLLMIVGIGGAALALASLGRCFGIFPEVRGLVMRGPYRLVRHPMYLFEFVAFLGVLAPAFTPLNAALYVIFTFLQLARINFEERALTATFPESYPRYCARTARLIPGVY